MSIQDVAIPSSTSTGDVDTEFRRKVNENFDDLQAQINAVGGGDVAVADGSITNAKLRNSAAYSVIGNPSNGGATPQDIPAGSNDTVLRRVANAVDFGQLTVGMFPNDLVTFAKMQNVSVTNRILGRLTAGAGDIEELTPTQITAMLNNFTSSLPGLVPLSGGGTTNYLRADGSWAVPPGAGGGGAVAPSNVYYADQISGVDNDDSTDCATAINAFIQTSRTDAVMLIYTPGIYRFNSPTPYNTGKVSVWVMPGASLRYYGAATAPFITFGVSTVTTNLDFNCEGDIRNMTTHDWSNTSFIGVRIERTKQAKIRIAKILTFTVNVECWGSSTSGIEFNQFYLSGSFDSRWHLHFHVAVNQGYVNANTFLSHCTQNTGSFPTSMESFGLYCTGDAGATNRSCNQNDFYNYSHQLGTNYDAGVQRIPFYFNDCGAQNMGHGGRIEGGAGQAAMKCFGSVVEVSQNHFEAAVSQLGEYTVQVQELGKAYDNLIIFKGISSTFVSTYHSGSLLKKVWPTSATTIMVEDCFMLNSANGAAESNSELGKIYYNYIPSTSNRAIGVFVNTHYYKQLEIMTNTEPGLVGRPRFVALDANFTVLTNVDTGYPHIRAGSGLTGSNTLYSYSYGYSNDQGNRFKIRVGDEVEWVMVLFVSGTSNMGLRSFSITGFTTEVGAQALYVTPGKFGSRQKMSSASPATIRNGHYSHLGMTVADSTGATDGWRCTAAGWNALAWTAGLTVVAEMIRENDTGKIYRARGAGTTAGSGGPTGTGTSINDNGVLWDYIGTLATWATSGGGSAYTDEQAQDAIGAMLVDSSEIDFTYTDATPALTAVLKDGSIALARLANLATARFMGRVTAGTGVPEAMTGTQATTLLDNFTSALKGLAPASGGGTSNYLRADGTWAAPPGSAGYTPDTPHLTADITSGLSDVYADITGLGVSVVAGGTYKYEYYLQCDADATTTGIDVAMNGPASPTFHSYMTEFWTSTTAIANGLRSTYDFNTNASGSQGTANRVQKIVGLLVNGANAGTLVPRVKRELTIGSGPNVRTGSFGIVTRIS